MQENTLTKEIQELIIQLIRFQTTSDKPKELQKAVDFIEDYFSNTWAYIYKYSRNNKPSIVIQNFEGKKADIMFNGHIDVVPANNDSQFDPTIKNGKLYARGAVDMKDGIAIMMILMKSILIQKTSKKKISLIITSDEEVGGFDGVDKLVNQEGYEADCIIIPDAGDLNTVVYSQKGSLHLEILAKGKSCHASERRLGDSPVDNIIHFYNKLREDLEKPELLNQEHSRRTTTVNLTNIIAGNGSANVIPETAQGKMDIRFTQDWKETSILNFIHDIASKYNIDIQKLSGGDVLHSDPEHEYIKNYLQIAKKNIGNDVKLGLEHGASDGRFFANDESIIIFHKGNGGNYHAKDEYSEIADYIKIYRCFEEFVNLK